MNLKILLYFLILLVVFNSSSSSIHAENLDETVIKKIDDIKTDPSSSLEQISLDSNSDTKLNVSDPSLKNISDKLSSSSTKDDSDDEINLKKVSERETKSDDKSDETSTNKSFSTKDGILIGSNQNGKDKDKHKISTQTNEEDNKQDTKQKQDDVHEPVHLKPDKGKADDLPSFDEWKKKVVEEEPNNQQNSVTINSNNKRMLQASSKNNKLRIRNYASSECGAKVINSNKEAQGSYKILSESQDEYMLNPCHSKVWFIIELCEAIKLSSIEVANYELFSSTFRDFLIYGSGHYPTRDWQLIGNFTANDVKQVQEFLVSGEVEFRKFIKIEILSHHGSEHFCPFSLVRAFGTSMTDEFDEIDNKIIPIDENELLRETNKSNENRAATKNYLNEKSVFYKILVKVAEFFYKNQPKRDRKDTKEENFARFLRDHDTLDAIIEQSVMNMMPILEPKLNVCLNLNKKLVKKHNKWIPFCYYLRTLVGATTFDLLIKEMTKDKNLQFKCSLNTNLTDMLNKKVQLINLNTSSDNVKSALESSRLDQILQITVNPDEGINSDVNSSPSTDSIKITSSNSQATLLLPTPAFVIDSDKHDEELSTVSSFYLPNGNDKSDDSTKIEKKLLEQHDKQSDNQIDGQLANEGKNEEITKPTATFSLDTATTSTEQQIKPTERVPASSENNSPIASSKPIHPADEDLPNGTPLSGSSSKETIFIRMINKIKNLELNLSLSSQYLEELSQRYRRQMDEMQKNFNQTIFKLNETSKTAAEKDNRQQVLLDKLGSQISDLEEKLFILLAVIIAKVIFDLISWYRKRLENCSMNFESIFKCLIVVTLVVGFELCR